MTRLLLTITINLVYRIRCGMNLRELFTHKIVQVNLNRNRSSFCESFHEIMDTFCNVWLNLELFLTILYFSVINMPNIVLMKFILEEFLFVVSFIIFN